jgi:hypothetical protein
MSKVLAALVAMAILATSLAFTNQDDTKKYGFIGAAKCGMCHKKDDAGAQLKIWQESAHAKAYKNLAASDAEAVKNEACLKCHSTGAGSDASLNDKKFSIEDGVQCEACHGPGSEYKSMKVMKSREESVANGLIVFADEKAIETTCLTCHNDANKPETHKKAGEFKFADKYAKIKHNKPAK